MDKLKQQIGDQADKVKALKASGDASVKAEVEILLGLKKQLATIIDAAKAVQEKKIAWRANFEKQMKETMFYLPSFSIYGGVGGLFDYGPTGCALEQAVLNYWRQHFVLTENMHEIRGTCLTPEVVLKTSGHVDRFTDFMVKDEKTNDCIRADHVLEDWIDAQINDPATPVTPERRAELLAVRTNADAYSQTELAEVLAKYKVTNPATGNGVTAPFPFNLMFGTQIGPTGKFQGYLRPETAQGIFVNFRRLLEFNSGRMPFAAAQIGLAFRNEIAPRAGLLRVREFLQAEIEHFCHPQEKDHSKFDAIRDVKMQLLSRELQTGEDIPATITIGEAVDTKMVANQTLGYFIARTHLFLIAIGVDEKRLRFRQHKSTEMAHYAQDCWDAEVETSYGWVECVGHADRAAYDLDVHMAKSKVELVAQKKYDDPKLVKGLVAKPVHAKFGKHFKKDRKAVVEYLAKADEATLTKMKECFESKQDWTFKICTGQEFTIPQDMCSVEPFEKKVSCEKYTPSVIEPSFGIGRIMYSVLEHAYREIPGKDKDGKETTRSVLALKAIVAPTKVAMLPISGNDADQRKVCAFLESELVMRNVSNKTDDSGVSIGRKYARQDEIGTPFAVTVDFDSKTDEAVTIRERDTTQQVRLAYKTVPTTVEKLIRGEMTWADLYNDPNVKKVTRE